MRGLHTNKIAPLDQVGEPVGGARNGIADGQHWRCALEEFQRGEKTVDDIRGTEGSGSVMDKDRIAFDCSEAVPDRVRALSSAFDQVTDV
ncbi:hypothetical protein GCM10022276_04170 [Sphingomonas limnosediminicola]|uniref:Uncharacterized protein n=1 Tax=Sphingomonas limnosediminicola TaxID=940133 RepID=A0ABP7KUB9_9SPHN